MSNINSFTLKNVNNCLNTSICSYLETSGGKSFNLYLNVVLFSSPVLINQLWQLKTVFFPALVSHTCCSIHPDCVFMAKQYELTYLGLVGVHTSFRAEIMDCNSCCPIFLQIILLQFFSQFKISAFIFLSPFLVPGFLANSTFHLPQNKVVFNELGRSCAIG